MAAIAKKLTLLIFSLLMLIFFSACATKMSLEEAKTVTISMAESPAFVPPPRRIDDIISILDQPGQFDRKITERFRIEADAVPPKKANSSFYHKRGEAARNLGRAQQALEDLREALRLSEEAGVYDSRILLHLAVVERDIGNFNRAVQLSEDAVKTGASSSIYEKLVETYIQMGDLERARNTAKNGKTYCAKSPKRRYVRFVQFCDIAEAGMEAAILEAQAKFKEAENSRRQHFKLVQNIKDEYPSWSINVRLQLAMNLMGQERFMEAEVAVREALKESLGHAGRDSLLTTRVIGRLANVLRAEGRLPEAEKLAILIIHALESSGISKDSRSMSLSRMMLGSILAAQNNFAGAMKQFDIALKDMKTDQYLYIKNFRGNPDFLLTLVMSGRSEEALKLLTNSYTRAAQRFGEKHYITAERLALRGMANHRMKNIREAERDFSTATDTLLNYQMDKADNSRIRRLKIILDDYINLLGEIHGTSLEKNLGVDAAGTAFRIAEASRGHTVQQALAASSARLAESNPELNDLSRHEQDAAKQMDVMEATVLDLIAAPSHEQKPEIIKDLQVKIISLSKARAALQEEIKRRFPKYADLANPQAATWFAAQQNLRPGEALISIYSSDHKTYVWAIPQRGKMSFFVSPLGKKELNRIVINLRKSLDPNPSVIGDIPEFDTASSYDLYKKLLKPVEDGWRDASDLLIVTSSPLDQIPLSVLPTASVKLEGKRGLLFSKYRDVPWLIRKASITILPSVFSLVTLRTIPAGDPNRRAFVGFGDPVFNQEQLAQLPERKSGPEPLSLSSRGAGIQVRGVRITEKGRLDNDDINTMQLGKLNRLPDTAEEIRSIAQALDADPDRDIFLGKDASKGRVKTMNLADRRVIAFATHALVPGDLDGLEQPALALSSPSVTGDNEDGLLVMGEIMKLKLNADWVVLSACNTAAAEGSGSEALSGLGRAFFYAGTRAILASMYPVETTSAQRLITSIFRYQRADKKLSRARALQKSMIDLMDKSNLVDDATGKIVASYAHPLFWAPFIVVGDPGEGN